MKKLRGKNYAPSPGSTPKAPKKVLKKAAAQPSRPPPLIMLGEHFYRVKTTRKQESASRLKFLPAMQAKEMTLRQLEGKISVLRLAAYLSPTAIKGAGYKYKLWSIIRSKEQVCCCQPAVGAAEGAVL